MLSDRRGGNEGQFAVDSVLILREGRDRADRVTGLQPLDAGTDRLDCSGRLVTDLGRKTRLFEIDSRSKHRFGPVETQCLHTDADFSRTGLGHIDRVNLENLRATKSVKSNNARHGKTPHIRSRSSGNAHARKRADA